MKLSPFAWILFSLTLVLVLVGCGDDRPLPPPITVSIQSIDSSDQRISEGIRAGIIQGLMDQDFRHYVTFSEGENSNLKLTVVVTFATGASSASGGFAFGNSAGASSESVAGTFISSVSCTARRLDGTIFGVSSFGQALEPEGRFAPPNECGIRSVRPLLNQIRQDQRARAR
jgi:hypothetical protein